MAKRESDLFLDGPAAKMFKDDLDDGSGGRTGRVRKKSAKVIEMEEFEHIEKTSEKKPGGKKTKTPKTAQKTIAQPDTPPAIPERPKKIKNVKAISGTVVGDISRPVAMISTPVYAQTVKPARMITTPVNPKSVNKGVAFKLEPEMSDTSPVKQEIKQEKVGDVQNTSQLATPGVTHITMSPALDGPTPSQSDQKSMIKYLLNSPSAGGKTSPSIVPEGLAPTPIPIIPVTPKQSGSKVSKKPKPISGGEGTPKISKATKAKKNKQEQQQRLSLQDTSESETSGMETSTPTATAAPSLKMKINLGPVPSSAVVAPLESPKAKKSKKIKQEIKQEITSESGHDSFTSDASPGFSSKSDGNIQRPASKKSKKKEKIMQDAISAAAKQIPTLPNFVSPKSQTSTTGGSVSPAATKSKKAKMKIKNSPATSMSSPPEGQLSMSEEMEDEDEEEAGLVIAEGNGRKKEKVLKKKASGKGKEKASKLNESGKPVEKRAPTAYMLFCNTHRPAIVNENPGIEFAAISKKLGEMWQTLSNKQKLAWRRKSQHRKQKKESIMISTGKNPSQLGGQSHSGAVAGGEGQLATRGIAAVQRSPRSGTEDVPQGPSKNFYSIEPIDVAAHLKLLGESLSIIGMRLQEHKGMIAVQGSLSVLLDSFVCACGPLLCLTQQVPGMDGCPPLTHARTLDSVAYVMPGL